MIVMGGIIGAGIFVNPSVVARQVHTPMLVLGAWIIGGIIALIGAFVYAELAVLRLRVGGQYAYLRDAYHPVVAFLYGWTLPLVVQTGGMAGAAIIFGRYFHELTGLGVPDQLAAACTLAILTAVNCLGVRAEHRKRRRAGTGCGDGSRSLHVRWLADSELRERRDARSAARSAARPDDRRRGRHRALSRRARDGVFFKAVGKLDARSRVPVVAIVLQGTWAIVIALAVKYDQILNYVVAIDVLFFGLTGASLLIFRARARRAGTEQAEGDLVRVPWHPVTTILFVLACWSVSLTTVLQYPRNAGIGVAILLLGVVVFYLWRREAPGRLGPGS